MNIRIFDEHRKTLTRDVAIFEEFSLVDSPPGKVAGMTSLHQVFVHAPEWRDVVSQVANDQFYILSSAELAHENREDASDESQSALVRRTRRRCVRACVGVIVKGFAVQV